MPDASDQLRWINLSSLAVVILAHTDPAHVRRLVRALNGVPVVLHCDAKTDDDTYRAMLDRRLIPTHRIATSLGSWSLVDAELTALATALRETSASHVAILSGSDYPLLPPKKIEAGLVLGESAIWNIPLPHDKWNTRLHHDGGLWRVRYRFWTRADNIVFLRGVPLRWPWPRRIPTGVDLRAGTQWKIYSRRHAEALLNVVAERPQLIRFWRSTLVPEETFAVSILASEALVGPDVLPTNTNQPWFMLWPDGDHPRWLTAGDFERLRDAATRQTPKLFARKFATAAAGPLLDRIDAELLDGVLPT